MNKTTNAAFNGLNYVSAFKAAFAEQNIKERVSIEHMETFFFMVTARNQKGVEMRRLQKALNYAQAKMHRTAGTLEALGWIDITLSAEDARQKEVALTESGKEFFNRLGLFLSTEERSSTFQKRSREMQEQIQEEAQHREAVRGLQDWQERSDRSDLQFLAGTIETAKPEVGSPEMDLHSLRRQIDEQEIADKATRDNIIRTRSIMKQRRIKKEEARLMLREVLMARGEREIEVGEKYIKTRRKIVTFPVLLKRTGTKSLEELVSAFKHMDDSELDSVLTPTPKTKIDRLKSELNSVLDRGWGAIEGNPHLFQRAHVLQSQIAAEEAKLDAKLGQGIGSLGDNPVTKDAWMAVVEEKAKKRISRGLMDPTHWEEEGE